MASVIQRNFAGGELAPALRARADQVKYQTGLRTLRNFFVRKEGGVSNRPGTEFLGEVKDSSLAVRLIPFVFNADQTYVLEFGHLYMRVWRRGALVLSTSDLITNGTFDSDIAGWTDLSTGGASIAWDAGAQALALVDPSGPGSVSIAQQAPTVPAPAQPHTLRFMVRVGPVTLRVGTTSGGQDVLADTAYAGPSGKGPPPTHTVGFTPGVSPIYVQFRWDAPVTNLVSKLIDEISLTADGQPPVELVTPYAALHLRDLQVVQSADVVTITHPAYAPRDLRRLSHISWQLVETPFAPKVPRPTNGAGSGSAGASPQHYRVTALDATFEESLPGLGPTKAITGATQANPVVITSTAHGFTNGEEVLIDAVVGMTELNDRTFTVANATANTFALQDTDGTGFGAYVSGGTAARTFILVPNVLAPSSTTPITLTWTAVAGAVEYAIYRRLNGVYGFIAVANEGATFVDTGFTPDTGDTPPRARLLFDGPGRFPSTVAYTQQRRAFANTEENPEGIDLSRTGFYTNFTTSSPLQDDDAISFRIAGQEVQAVRHLFELGSLIVLTSGGEWVIRGDADRVIRPFAINPRQEGYSGASPLRPVVLGNTALYVQALGSVVRDLRYELQSDSYAGQDLTIYASHLVEGHTLVAWAYAQVPYALVSAVRDDGMLLMLAYLREHEVWGWSRSDTGQVDALGRPLTGFFEDVVVVPEDGEHRTYFVVRRTVNGETKRYLERLARRRVTDVAVDAFFVDSGLTYDGRNANAAHTMTLSGGVTWAHTEDLTLESSAAFFSAGEVGNAIVLEDPAGVEAALTCTITAFTDPTHVTVRADRIVPTPFRTVALGTWARAVDVVAGLGHLEGETVGILGDGHVVTNGVDAPLTVVTGAQVTLARPYAVIHVGLPLESDFETLDLDPAGGSTSLRDKKKLVRAVTLEVEASRGIWAGTAFDNLREHQPILMGPGAAIGLHTGQVELPLSTSWTEHGRIVVRQRDPLPLTILAAIPDIVVGV